MSTYKVRVTGGELEALSDNAYCRSSNVEQDIGDTDFESIREIRSQKLLKNQLVEASADTAYLRCGINEGDRIFIKDSSNVVHDTVASNVIEGAFPISTIPLMISNTLPSGIVSSSNGSSDAWKVFDQDDGTAIGINSSGINYIIYEFPALLTEDITSMYIKINGDTSNISYYVTDIKVFGSLDGIRWQLMYDNYTPRYTNGTLGTVNMQYPGKFKFIKIQGYGSMRIYFHEIKIFTGHTGTSINTSVVTNGATPTHVWKYEDTIKFNNTPTVEKDIFFEYGTTGNYLYLNVAYHDVLLSGRLLDTYIKFEAEGNKVLDITGQIFKDEE